MTNLAQVRAIAAISALEPRDPILRIETELAASAISPEIARQHFWYIDGDEAVEFIAGTELGQSDGHGKQYVTADVRRILRRYEHLRYGGWAFQGLDPLADFGLMEWGCLKPFSPRISQDKGQPIKYEHPSKTPTRVFIAGDPSTWQAIQKDPSTALLITEGAKKTAAPQSYGIPAIGLPGIWNGTRKGADGIHRLIPELLSFCLPGRVWLIDFDVDTKASAKRAVSKATATLARALEAERQQVRIVRRDGSGHKGTDDFIAAEGIQTYRDCLSQAEPLGLWQARRYHHGIRSLAGQQVSYSDLSDLDPKVLPTSGIVGIRSPKGTGKTVLLGKIIEGSPRVVALSHRISLGRNLSQRLGLIWQEDRRMGWQHRRLCSTVDSLMRILPSNVEGGTLVLDEASQIIGHLLTSSTLKRRRGPILKRFRELVLAADRILVADADLTQLELDYLAGIRGGIPWVLDNQAIPAGAPVRYLESSDASVVLPEIDKAIRAGETLYICTNSRQTADRIEAHLNQTSLTLLVTARTSGGAEQQAFLRDPDGWLSAHPGTHVIASPSVGSGLSIEGSHFDRVVGIFGADSITAADAAQALGRVRKPIPRLVWAATGRTTPEGSNRLRIVSDECHRLAASTHLNGGTLAEVQKALGEGSPELALWGEITGRANWSRANFRDHLRVILEGEGSQVVPVEVEPDPEWRGIWRKLGQLCKLRTAEAVASSPAITPERAEMLAVAPWKTPEDADSLERFYLKEFYRLEEVDPELVLADCGGRRRKALRRLEGLAFVDIVKTFDERQAEMLDPELPTIWDFPHSHLEREVMTKLGIPEFLDWALAGKEWQQGSPEVKAVAARIRANPDAVRQALRFTVSPKASDTQLIGEILSRLGLKTTSTQKRVTPHQLAGNKSGDVTAKKSDRVRVYSLDHEHLAEVVAILKRRHQHRQQGSNPIPDENIPKTLLTRLIGEADPTSTRLISDLPTSHQADP